MTIEPLTGDYCEQCVKTLSRVKDPASIFPMCEKDLRQFMTNGDFEIASKLIKEKSHAT